MMYMDLDQTMFIIGDRIHMNLNYIRILYKIQRLLFQIDEFNQKDKKCLFKILMN